MEEITIWLEGHQELVAQMGTLSIVLLVISLVVLPKVVRELPEDYFTNEKREPAAGSRKHPLIWGALSLLKNLVGLVLIVAGVAMLVLPGQGTVTILIGLALTNFPGKFAIERKIVCQPAVGEALNKIRTKGGKPPLRLPADGA